MQCLSVAIQFATIQFAHPTKNLYLHNNLLMRFHHLHKNNINRIVIVWTCRTRTCIFAKSFCGDMQTYDSNVIVPSIAAAAATARWCL